MATELPLLTGTSSGEEAFHLPGRWWHAEDDRIVCDLCPRKCSLKERDRGFCFVRQNLNGQMMLTTYGRSTGFCIDPIEKKPLNHFYPGTSVLSFGTAGCNLGCKLCQNWDISKSRQVERLSEQAYPEDIARAAKDLGCLSVAFTYNDPVIWAEYAIETARACHALGLKSVAVTAGYITEEARTDFYEVMDAANVDLKAFTEDFYHKLTLSHIQPVLDTLRWLKKETDVWFEITNLVIPDANDGSEEFQQLCDWVLEAVGDEVPLHFSAFHPDFRMMDRPRTPPETLNRAREIAYKAGLKYVYTGNVDDASRQSTYCPQCRNVVIERNWYQLGQYALNQGGYCQHCGYKIPGHFERAPGNWGRRRLPVDMRRYHASSSSQLASPPIQHKNPSSARSLKPMSETVPQQLDLTENQKAALLSAAAEHIISASHGWQPNLPDAEIAGLGSQVVSGVYVSLKRKGRLRSCCGSFGKPAPLKALLADAAFRTATNDPRFPQISPNEIPFLDLEVWVLLGGSLVQEQGEERIQAVTVGKHGLHIGRENQRGLLLPGVATDNGWNSEEFLNQVCIKAGLPPTAWKDDSTSLVRFEGEVVRRSLSENGSLADRQPLLAQEHLYALSNFYQQNLEAIVRGATPAYYAAGLPDANVNGVAIVLSFQGTDAEISGWRTTLLGSMPLQSTLFSLTEDLAATLRRQGINQPFTMFLAILSDPTMHGTAAEPDLRGINPGNRCVYISERSKAAWIYNPSKGPEELLRSALEAANVVMPEATQIFSFEVLSTRENIQVQSVPRPHPGSDIRPPGVAGKFYPRGEQQITALLNSFLADEPKDKKRFPAIMVPHAGWQYSGKIAGDVLKQVDFPKTVIAIGPKHTAYGVEWAVAPHQTWSLPSGNLASDPDLAKKLAENIPGLQLDAAAHQLEHGIEVELPFIVRLAPDTKVVGITIGGGNLNRCDQFAEGLSKVIGEMEEKPLLLISSDMNHFASDAENRRLDEMALAELDKLDEDGLYETVTKNHISMCGVLPAIMVIKTLKKLNAVKKSQRVSYATTADTTGNPDRVVGYAGMVFE